MLFMGNVLSDFIVISLIQGPDMCTNIIDTFQLKNAGIINGVFLFAVSVYPFTVIIIRKYTSILYDVFILVLSVRCN